VRNQPGTVVAEDVFKNRRRSQDMTYLNTRVRPSAADVHQTTQNGAAFRGAAKQTRFTTGSGK